MNRQAPQTVSVFGAVTASFALVVLISFLSGLVFLVSGWDSLFPEFVRFPMIEDRPSASPPREVADEIQQTYPQSTVILQEGRLLVIEGDGTGSLRQVRPILRRHGYSVNRFTIGRDLSPDRLILRFLDHPGLTTFLLLTTPLTLLAVSLIALRLSTIQVEWRRFEPGDLGWGLVAGLFLVACTVGLSLLLEFMGWKLEEQPIFEALLDGRTSLTWLVVFVVVGVAPLAEELFFRAWMFGALREVAGPWAAYPISAILFASLHFHWAATPVYILYGIGLAYLYHRRGSVWCSVVAHSVINITAILYLLLEAG